MKTEQAKGCILIIGGILIFILIFQGVIGALSWFESIPWYAYFPLLDILAYTIFRIGKHFNLWS